MVIQQDKMNLKRDALHGKKIKQIEKNSGKSSSEEMPPTINITKNIYPKLSSDDEEEEEVLSDDCDGPALEGSRNPPPRKAPLSKINSKPTAKVLSGEEKADKSNLHNLRILLLIIAIVIPVVLFFTQKPEDKINKLTALEEFNNEFAKTERLFSSQPKNSFEMIQMAAESVFEEDDPSQPAIILFLGTKGSEKVTNNLLSDTYKAMSKGFGTSSNDTTFLDCSELKKPKQESDKEATMIYLQDKVEETLKYQPIMIIRNMDELVPNTMSILQTYFDHENAPFKKAAFLLSATMNEKVPSSSSENLKTIRELARKHFSQVWTSYPEEFRDAFLSRMLHYVVIVY